MVKLLLIVLTIVLVANADSATVAPDFTVTDIDGNTHHLDEYTSNGKYVLLEIFMAEN
jgi:uncharacterized Rossmann fold enzyme